MPLRYVCDSYEDMDCGYQPEPEEFDEDLAYDESRERAAGWED